MLEQGLTKEHWFNAAQFTTSICRAIVRQGAGGSGWYLLKRGRRSLFQPRNGAKDDGESSQTTDYHLKFNLKSQGHGPDTIHKINQLPVEIDIIRRTA